MKSSDWNIEFILFVEKMVPVLKEHKWNDNPIAFNELFAKSLAAVKVHISRSLKSSVKNGTIPEGKYTLDDVLNQLYIYAYDNIEEVVEDHLFHSWIFKKADEILDDIIVDEDFDNTFFKNIDNYTKVEWETMEEKYSVDVDGDLIMEEDLDDISYPRHDYILEDVFIENKEDKLIEKINKELTKEEIHNHLLFALHFMPYKHRVLFELSANDLFDDKEISYIRNISVDKVKENLIEVRKLLQKSLSTKVGSK